MKRSASRQRDVNCEATVSLEKARSDVDELLRLARNRDVLLTELGEPVAYLISPERFQVLMDNKKLGADISRLLGEIDRAFEDMQTPKHRAAVTSLMTVSDEELMSMINGDNAEQPVRPVAKKRRNERG